MPYSEPNPDDPAYWRKPHDSFDIDDPPERDTPARVGWLIFVIGWSSSELARRLNIAPESARGWISGKREAPASLVPWLEDLAAFHLQHRQPPGWQAR